MASDPLAGHAFSACCNASSACCKVPRSSVTETPHRRHLTDSACRFSRIEVCLRGSANRLDSSPLSGRIMRKLGQFLLAGTMLSGITSVATIASANAEPVILAAAACPQGQVGTPPNCKPAPHPQPAQPHPQVQQPHPQVQQPHPQVQQPHPQVQQPHPQVQQPQQQQQQQREREQREREQRERHEAHPQQPTQPQIRQTQPTQPQPTQPQIRQTQPNQTQPTQPQIRQTQPNQTQPTQPQIRQTQPIQPNQPQPNPQVRQNPNQPGPDTAHRAPPPPPPRLPTLTATQATPLPKRSGPPALTPTNPQGQPITTVAGLRNERHEQVVNGQTVITEGHRVIVRAPNGAMVIRHDDVDRFRYGARDVKIERRGNDSVTTVVLGNGSRVVTTLGPDGRILRRSRFDRDGREIVLIAAAVTVGVALYVDLPPPVIRIPRDRYIVDLEAAPPDYVYDAFTAPPVEQVDQGYSLDQVLDSPSVRDLMPSVDIDTLTFETGSWEVGPDQVDRLQVIADNINKVISANPKEVFLIEGHTDAVGNDVDNMSLSDRRAETVALILSDKFGVPPENLVTQGYGSQFLRIPTPGPERRNRRVTVRRITPLLANR